MSLLPGVPLMGKELAEQAERRRTYLLRCACALMLLGFFGTMYEAQVSFDAGVIGPASLGGGSWTFNKLVYVQMAAVYVFLPALMCGAIAGEKETGSLSLLLITDLRPGEILLQKYVSRLIPMFSILLLSLPLFALSYAQGGISTIRLGEGALMVALCCLQTGAIALMCSSYAGTAGRALVGTYAAGFVLFGVPDLVASLLTVADLVPRIRAEYTMALFPPFVFDDMGGATRLDWSRAIPVAYSTACFLAAAWLFLTRRAFVPPHNVLLGWFRRVDRVMNKLNKLTGGRMLLRQRRTLPGTEPVSWREVNKKSLGRPHYQLRLLLAMEVPLIVIALLAAFQDRSAHIDALEVMVLAAWCVAALVVATLGASLVSGERLNRTLDLLLVTPMTGEQIVRQKAHGLWRLALVLAIPIATLVSIEMLFEYVLRDKLFSPGVRRQDGFDYLLCSALAITVYLPLIGWLGLWVGTRVRSRFRAIVITLLLLVAWVVLPVLVVAGLAQLDIASTRQISWLLLASPGMVLSLAEEGRLVRILGPNYLMAVMLNFGFYAGCAGFIRWRVLRGADRRLGRPDE